MSKVAMKWAGPGEFYGYAGEAREVVECAEGGTVEVSESAAKHLESDFPTSWQRVQTKPAAPQVKK